MFTLFDKFPSGMKVTSVPISWFRKVTAFLTNFCPGTGIRISAPATPEGMNPVVIGIDPEYMRGKLAKYATKADLKALDARLRNGLTYEGGGGGAPDQASSEDKTESGGPVAPTQTATDDSADYTSGGDTIVDGDTVDTTNWPEAANDTLRWMNNAAANLLGYFDGSAAGAWTSQTALSVADPLDANAQSAVAWRHHVPLRCLIFSRDKAVREDRGDCKLLFARPAEIDATGRIRYVGSEICIARVLGYNPGTSTTSATVTDSSSPAVTGIVDADVDSYTQYVDAALATEVVTDAVFNDPDGNAIPGVIWRAGCGANYEEATVTRFVPLMVGANHGTIYFKVFVRIHEYASDGRLYQVRSEIDHGIILRGY